MPACLTCLAAGLNAARGKEEGVEGRPPGTQEDLGSCVISESQAAAMSPDYWFPVDLSIFSPLSLPDYGTVPGLWLLCYGRGQIQTNPHTLVHTDVDTHTHTGAHNRAEAQSHTDGGW